MSEEIDVAAPEQSESSQPTESQVSSPAPQQSEPAGQQPAAQPMQSAGWGVMDNFRRLPQFQGMGEEQIARALYQSMQQAEAATHRLAQYQQFMPYAQDYMANRPQYEAWKASQHPQAQQAQQLQQTQQQPEQPWWDPPKVRESDKRWMTRDPETGRDVISPDAPLDVRRNLEELQAYKAEFAKNFLSDPEKALAPMVEGRAKEIAREIVDQTLRARDTEQFVSSLEKDNSDWLFDQTGQVTPEGFLVHKYIEEAKNLGIQDPKDRWEHATRNVERELLIQRYQEAQQQLQQYAAYIQQGGVPQQPPQPAAPPPAPAPAPQAPPKDLAKQNMEFLRREASRTPSRSAGTSNADPRAPRPKLSFEQMFVQDAQARGLM